jgi:hypothetical protein
MPEFTIRLLVYDERSHQFNCNLDVHSRRQLPEADNTSGGFAESSVSMEDLVGRNGISPSEGWMQDYLKWLSFGKNAAKGRPIFSSIEDLNEFNDTGVSLVSRLRAELDPTKVTVVDFQSLYSNIEVGNAVAAWWHIKDQNYNLVVPIQNLPVSDALKSRLQAWRCQKGTDWLDVSYCEILNKERRDLEEHILWELNVRENKDPTDKRRPVSKQESFESVHFSSPVVEKVTLAIDIDNKNSKTREHVVHV